MPVPISCAHTLPSPSSEAVSSTSAFDVSASLEAFCQLLNWTRRSPGGGACASCCIILDYAVEILRYMLDRHGDGARGTVATHINFLDGGKRDPCPFWCNTCQRVTCPERRRIWRRLGPLRIPPLIFDMLCACSSILFREMS